MAIRLKGDEKPRDPKLTVCKHIIPWDKTSDAVWMTYEEWSRKGIEVNEDAPNVPESIKALIPRWRQLAMDIEKKAKENEFWPVKGAYSKAFFYDAVYEFDVGILHGIGNYITNGWLFESIESEIEKDLYSLGAVFVEYYGMMD